MRHRVQGRKLGLPSNQRVHLLKNLVKQLFASQAIVTTETRAKEVRRIAERLITRAKSDTLHNRRLSRKWLSTHTPTRRVAKPIGYSALHPVKKAKITLRLRGRKPVPTGTSTQDFVNRLFRDIAPRMVTRPGGYTRMYKLGFRKGDAAPIVKLELVLE